MMRLYFITALIASQAFIVCGQTSTLSISNASESGFASVSDSSNNVSMSSSPSSSVSMSASTPSSVSVSASTPSSVSMSASPSTTMSMSAPPSTSVSMSASPSDSVSMSASPSDSVSMSTSPSTSVSMSNGVTSTPTSTSESTASVTTTQPPTTVTVVIIVIYVEVSTCTTSESPQLVTNLTTNLKNIYKKGAGSDYVTEVELQSLECKDSSLVSSVRVTFRAGFTFSIEAVLRTEIEDGSLGDLPVRSSPFEVTPIGVSLTVTVVPGECQRVCCEEGAGGPVMLDQTCTPKASNYSCDGISQRIEREGYCPGEDNGDECSEVCNGSEGFNHSPSIFLLLLTAVASFFKFSV